MARVPIGFIGEKIHGTGFHGGASDFTGPYKITWFKKLGERVQKGEEVVEVETDKSLVSIKADTEGVLVEQVFVSGEVWRNSGTVELCEEGTLLVPPLGFIETGVVHTKEVETKIIERPIIVLEKPQVLETEKKNEIRVIEERKPSQDVLRIVPKARVMAHEKGIDLKTISGTGPDGVVTVSDVSSNEGVLMSSRDETQRAFVRRRIAHLLTMSKKEIVAAGDSVTVDVTELVKFRKLHKNIWLRITGTKLRLDYIFGFLCIKLLQLEEFKVLNGYWDKELEAVCIVPHVNFGIAVETQWGLMVPVIHEAEHMNFVEFAQACEVVIDRVTEGKPQFRDFYDFTFTLNNPGIFGGELPRPVVPFSVEMKNNRERPTSYILALGALGGHETKTMNLSFEFDHRAFDGKVAIGFVMSLKRYIESKPSYDGFEEICNSSFNFSPELLLKK